MFHFALMMHLFQLLNLYNTKIGLLIVEVYTFCHFIESNNNNNLIIMELDRIFVRTNLRNSPKKSQRTRTKLSYHLMPVCLSSLSAVRLSIIRSYTLHQTEYDNTPCQKQWVEACIVPVSWYLPELLLLKCHHRNAVIGICRHSAIAVEAHQRWAASASNSNNNNKCGIVVHLYMYISCM